MPSASDRYCGSDCIQYRHFTDDCVSRCPACRHLLEASPIAKPAVRGSPRSSTKILLGSGPILSPQSRSLPGELLRAFSQGLPVLPPAGQAPECLRLRRIVELQPGLVDDYYLNLLDWSPEGVVAVGLGSVLQLWQHPSETVGPVKSIQISGESICAIRWAPGGKIMLGLGRGKVLYLDVERDRPVSTYQAHSKRVGSIAYHAGAGIFSTGSKDCSLRHLDPRLPRPLQHTTCRAHEQEICGLQWECRLGYLASGGNDNELLIWDIRALGAPALMRCTGHEAAVKAIAWSPHRRGLLASGGGTADRTIRMWRLADGAVDDEGRSALGPIAIHDSPVIASGPPPPPLPHCLITQKTGSQVCGMAWSPTSEQLVSAHGFSEHQCLRWSYGRDQVLGLTGIMKGHTQRVLGLAVSPCGEAVATASPDGTLRFWSVFSPTTARRRPSIQRGGILDTWDQLRGRGGV